MAQDDALKDLFVDAIATAARLWAARYWDGGTASPGIAFAPPPAELDNSTLLTRQEAARLLKVSPTQITRMRAKGQIEPVKRLLPGKVRYLKADIEKFIHKRR